MIALVKYGATPTQALVAATRNGAALAGWSDMGMLEVGKVADFVALDGDPTRSVACWDCRHRWPESGSPRDDTDYNRSATASRISAITESAARYR